MNFSSKQAVVPGDGREMGFTVSFTARQVGCCGQNLRWPANILGEDSLERAAIMHRQVRPTLVF